MKSLAKIIGVFFVAALALGGVMAQQSTPQLLKVQGFLSDQSGGSPLPANGTFNMTFKLFDDEFAGLQHGSTLAEVVTVTDGVYDVSLAFDTDVFDGPDRWIEIAVEGEVLSPRVRAFSTPYAFRAEMLDDKDSVDLDQAAAVAAMQGQIAALQATVDGLGDLQGQIDSLVAQLAVANATIAALQANSVLDLDGKLSLVGDTARFSGVNVQVVNGIGEWGINGLGNLIVGYDSVRPSGDLSCSIGTYDNQTDCENNSGTWALSHKTGSHNLVVGVYNNYSSRHGFVAGQANDVSMPVTSVSGGWGNRANAVHASVSGGWSNSASGFYSSVSGGYGNQATGSYSSVGGGRSNTASGSFSSVSGGESNTASGESSSVSGGESNTASGGSSSVSGGQSNMAVGNYSTVTGGMGNAANDEHSTNMGEVDTELTLDELTVRILTITGG
jgi:hypothetical protein